MDLKKTPDIIYNQLSTLLHSYISEDQLNSAINEIQDLSLLQIALKLKLSLIVQNKHVPIYFPVSRILDQISIGNIEEVCHTVYDALKVQNNEEQYVVLLEFLNQNLMNNEESSLIKILRLLRLAITLCESGRFQRAFKKFSVDNNLHNSICKLLSNDSKMVIHFVSVFILSQYLKIDDSSSTSSLLQNIWKNTLKTKNLDILCTITEFFLGCSNSQFYSLSLVNQEQFWLFLQDCVNINNSTVQKQALYLLKWARHSLRDRDSFETQTKVVFWDAHCKKEMEIAWQNLFMLFEISREKQLHLIEPAYQLLPSIKILHSSWLICIYKILLIHPHSAVAAHSISDLLNCEWYDDVDSFKTAVKNLLPALNKIEYVQKEIWNKLHEFNKKLHNERFLILLKESTIISWIPTLCYKFYSSIFRQARTMIIPTDLIQATLRNTERLPHKFIRHKCMELIVNFVNRTFLSRNNFHFTDYVALCCLYSDEYLQPQKLPNIAFNAHTSSVKEVIKSWILNKNVNLKEVQVILNVLGLSLVDDEFIKNHMFQPFLQGKFATEVSDTLCVFLYSKGFEFNVVWYVQERLSKLKPDDEVAVENIIKLLIKKEDCAQLLDLFKMGLNILLSEESNLQQVEAAFAVVDTSYQNSATFALNAVGGVVEKWKAKLLEDCRQCNNHICASFLSLYCKKELHQYNACDQSISLDKLSEIIAFFERMMDTQSYDIVPEIFLQLRYILQLNEGRDVIFGFIDVCLRKLIELKRADVFKPAVENFIGSIFANTKICEKDYNDEHVLQKCVNIAWVLLALAKSYDDVASSLATNLHHLAKYNVNAASKFIPIVVELLLFGDVLKKEQRAEYVVCQEIGLNGNTAIDENNPVLRKLSVRGRSVNIIQLLLNNNCTSKEGRTIRADELTSLLIDKYLVYFDKRYFADSQIHLQKLRILQAFLVVHNYIKAQKQPLIDLLLNSLCSESHQISIRFLIIWLLVRLLYDNDECLTIVTQRMESTSKVHSSTIIAFIPILYHVALLKNDESFFNNLLKIMLPWTMGAHFNLRLYAQEGIVKLYDAIQKRSYSKTCEDFKTIVASITDVLDKTERRIDEVDRYIFDVFHPQDHYNLQTIYFDIPCITNVTNDEYENIPNIPEFNVCNKIKSRKQLINTFKESSKLALQTNLIQKKITPLANIFEENINRNTGELIVVASLINKAPNLGGLSRTCEIFGVKQLVISTANVIKNLEFQSVSMSSENWVDIAERKVDDLQSYLLGMKENGYSIIGAEQTSNSVKLNTFQFPKKCILLLGNEKEGIPPNLLSLIDTCVEIPQFGVVRSLNVHVAAATFIWEYTKQHIV